MLRDTCNPACSYGIKIAVDAFAGAILLLALRGTAIARRGVQWRSVCHGYLHNFSTPDFILNSERGQ
jgi:hypothetical protein